MFLWSEENRKTQRKPSEKDGNQQEIKLSHTVPESNPSLVCGIGGLAGKRAKRDTKARNATTCTCDRVSRSCITLRGLAPPLIHLFSRLSKGAKFVGGEFFPAACSPQQSTNTVSFVPAENHTYNEKFIFVLY